MPTSSQKDNEALMYVRIPAFSEFPMISVVHPAYHALPNGGHPSFLPSGSRRLSCVRVFATTHSPVRKLIDLKTRFLGRGDRETGEWVL